MYPIFQGALQHAIQAFQGGNLDGAKSILTAVLQNDINSADAIFGVAINCAENGRVIEALEIFECLKLFIKNEAQIPYNLGCLYVNQGNYESAYSNFYEALAISPNDIASLVNCASALHELGRFKEAISYFEIALSLEPNCAQIWCNKGNTLRGLKFYDEAIAHYDKALSLGSDYHEAWTNKGSTLSELKRYDEAIAHYDRALALNPGHAETWFNKGITLNELKRYDDAIAHYDKVLTIKPDYVEAWLNKGAALSELKRYDEAITHCDMAISLKPDYHEAWTNKGVVLSELKRYDDAITHYDKALTIKPDYAEAWLNRGNTLNELKRYDEVITHYDKALSLNADIDWVYGDLLHTKMKICDWAGLSHSLENISKKVFSHEKVIAPFPLLALIDNAKLHKKNSEIYTSNKYPTNAALGPISRYAKNEKIRIGYFSADFRNHAVSILAAELFELHDKNRFEVIAFSFGSDDGGPLRLRLSRAFNQFIDVSGLPDLDIARLARDLKIDIAVDLAGHTSNSRMGIFAYRTAPIQVGYLGYLGTIGGEYFDYIFADKTIIPKGSEIFYSEKIAHLPSYQVNDRRRKISDKVFSRQQLGLPENGFVFCCFNNNYKILPSIFNGWMRILKAVEGSVLFLYAENEWVVKNLKKEAEARGVNSTRLVFCTSIPADEYLARYHACDLFLDTAPYNAGTTASDALWAGVPILTLIGQSFASRMASSLLYSIGLQELITGSQKEYEALAIELALNPKRFEDTKLRLVNNRLTAPLFDTPLFTVNLEAAYIKIYERYHAGLQPDHISISS